LSMTLLPSICAALWALMRRGSRAASPNAPAT
jgi:hypothetical protein